MNAEERCPLPTVKAYGPGSGMVRAEIARPAPSLIRPETPDRGPPSQIEVIEAWILCALLFVLAFAVASFARFLSAF